MPKVIKHTDGLVEIIKTTEECELERLKKENEDIKKKLDKLLGIVSSLTADTKESDNERDSNER